MIAAGLRILVSSQTSPDAGTYVLRHEDIYISRSTPAGPLRPGLLRPSTTTLLSIEVSGWWSRLHRQSWFLRLHSRACRERHLFRSTSYHSTVQIDDEEQQTIIEEALFVTEGEAAARVLVWDLHRRKGIVLSPNTPATSVLTEPVIGIVARCYFEEPDFRWLIEDELFGQRSAVVFPARFPLRCWSRRKTLLTRNSVIGGETQITRRPLYVYARSISGQPTD